MLLQNPFNYPRLYFVMEKKEEILDVDPFNKSIIKITGPLVTTVLCHFKDYRKKIAEFNSRYFDFNMGSQNSDGDYSTSVSSRCLLGREHFDMGAL